MRKLFRRPWKRAKHDKADLFDKLKHAGCLPADAEMSSEIDETLLTALHRYAAMSRSKLYAVQLENLLGMSDNLNVPGVPRVIPTGRRKMPSRLKISPQPPDGRPTCHDWRGTHEEKQPDEALSRA